MDCLSAFEFDNLSLFFIYSYLSERKQRTKINSSFSCWPEILLGVPQGSMLRTILFNAYIGQLFLDVRDYEYGSFADDTTLYTCLPDMIFLS